MKLTIQLINVLFPDFKYVSLKFGWVILSLGIVHNLLNNCLVLYNSCNLNIRNFV